MARTLAGMERYKDVTTGRKRGNSLNGSHQSEPEFDVHGRVDAL